MKGVDKHMARIPKFKSEDEEREYWEEHSPLEHLDELSEDESLEVGKRPPKVQISLRIRPELKADIERLAKKRGLPYQTLIHGWITERYYAESQQTPGDSQLVRLIETVVDRRLREALEKQGQKLESQPAIGQQPTRAIVKGRRSR